MTWDVSTPADNEVASQGATRMREFKSDVATALTTEGIFPGATPATPVFRLKPMAGNTASRPTGPVTGQIYINTQKETLERYDGSQWVEYPKSLVASAIHSPVPITIASALGVVTLTEAGNSFVVTGTEKVTSITGWSAGIVRVRWDSARIIEHSASLYLNGAISRNVVAGDMHTFEFSAAGTCREIAFHGACGTKEIGESFIWNGATAPAGSFEEDGRELLRADYPGLFARIGTVHGTSSAAHFNIPDSRGRFVRGYDHAAGRDPDAAARTASATGGATGDNVGSVQADAFKAHTHSANSQIGSQAATSGGGAYDSAGNTGSTGGNETRPINRGAMYCIKY